jgi:hypothetical protein
MRTFKTIVLIIVTLYELVRWEFELPGGPGGKPSKRPNAPKGRRDLEQELGDRMPKEVYKVFNDAVADHRRKKYASALRKYEKLRHIPLRDGTSYDLWSDSSVFRHNWNLLQEDMKRSLGR